MRSSANTLHFEVCFGYNVFEIYFVHFSFKCGYIWSSSDVKLEQFWAPFYQARVIIDPKIDSHFDPLKINYNF